MEKTTNVLLHMFTMPIVIRQRRINCLVVASHLSAQLLDTENMLSVDTVFFFLNEKSSCLLKQERLLNKTN